MCGVHFWSSSISELWPFDSVFILILCNLHNFTPINLLTVRDIHAS